MDRDEQTIDMFGEQLDAALLSDTINIIEDEKTARWPETMRELYTLFLSTVKKHGDSPDLAIILLAELCRVYGGLQFYLPRGKLLQNTIRDLRVWSEFKGDNTFELAQKYKVTQREIWRITARMRKFEMKRRQPDLFGEN
ncbi:Mor transcription activator family protein [Aeromonas dhakensis]|uniref:Mor transcription activator family protein n=1 Tax=Aeromonas dhakensis TaxID=196024 RepID=UPI000F87D8BF|nr:Mor transcription activator family protein [Aeromonas dhakensis]RUQ10687.1 hypothetical protein CX648_21045 [Aeromonas dhakensis]